VFETEGNLSEAITITPFAVYNYKYTASLQVPKFEVKDSCFFMVQCHQKCTYYITNYKLLVFSDLFFFGKSDKIG